MNEPNEKVELIELALQEAVGGGGRNLCGWECRAGTADLCHMDFCET